MYMITVVLLYSGGSRGGAKGGGGAWALSLFWKKRGKDDGRGQAGSPRSGSAIVVMLYNHNDMVMDID